MKISVETLDFDLISDCTDIIDRNYLESGHQDDELDIDWDMYLSCGSNFLAIILREEDDNIVGVLFFILTTYPHIKTLNMAQQITYYIDPKFRNNSNAMIDFSEKFLEEIGVNYITQSARYDSNFCKTLIKKNYEKQDVTFTKRLS